MQPYFNTGIWRLLVIGLFAEVIRRKLTLYCSNRALGFDLLQDPPQIPDYGSSLLQFENPDFAIMDQGVEDRQPDVLASPKRKHSEQSQSNEKPSLSGPNFESADFNTDSPPFRCNWTGCSSKAFTRKSDLRKHWDRHIKPYVCDELGCKGNAFGDKASLHRHETEKHGKHSAKRYLCPVESCPRARKGFPRKSNRNLHVTTRHNDFSFATPGGITEDGGASESPEQTVDEGLGTQLNCGTGEMAEVENRRGLEFKLKELEKEKSALDLRRSRVDEDIRALKRSIQLVAA